MEFVYKGLRAQYTPHTVTDDEVAQQLERLRQQTPKIQLITDRPAREGDEVVLDYAGFCDGEQFRGGTATDQTLVLGSGMFIPGFEEQLMGCEIDQQTVVNVTFPEDYHAPNLAGKAAQFHCVIHQIREKSTWDLTDEFAHSMGLANLEHLRQELKSSMQTYADDRGRQELEEKLIRQAAETLDYQVDEADLDKMVDEQMETLRRQLARQGIALGMYSQISGKSEEEMRAELRVDARQVLCAQAAAEEIARLEGITATEEEIADSLSAICRQNRITMEQFKQVYDDEFRQAVERSIRRKKVLTLVRETAILEIEE